MATNSTPTTWSVVEQVLRPAAHRQLHRPRLQRGVGREGVAVRGRVQPGGAELDLPQGTDALRPGIYDSDEVSSHATEGDPWALEWLRRTPPASCLSPGAACGPASRPCSALNENYFGEQPYFDRVIYRAVPSGASRVTLLKSGQVHWIDRPSIQQVIDLQGDDAVKVWRAPAGDRRVRMNPNSSRSTMSGCAGRSPGCRQERNPRLRLPRHRDHRGFVACAY